MNRPVPHHVSTAVDIVDGEVAVDHVIAERRRNSSDGSDLLSILMSARDEETGEAMTDEPGHDGQDEHEGHEPKAS